MAFSNNLGSFGKKVRGMIDKFFYEDGEEEQSSYNEAAAFSGQQDTEARQAASYFAENTQAGPQPYVQQGYPPQTSVYQQSPYQYQPQAQPINPQYNAQFRPTQRNRRAQQEISDQSAMSLPQQSADVPAADTDTEPAVISTAGMSMRVMSVHSVQDCRVAISLLRGGDAVLLTMEGVTDGGEMRRFVDTLSGACFSLTATITKVSRYGCYLLAPSAFNVFCDGVISRMNTPPRPQMPPAQAAAGVQNDAPPKDVPDEQPSGASDKTPFYMRKPQQMNTRPIFEQQPAGKGYVPDFGEQTAR